MNIKKDKNAKFNPDNIHPIKMILLEGQAEIILRALELYAYNLEYMLSLKDFKLENDEILNKRAKLRYTYETIAFYCAEARGWEIRDNVMDNVRDKEINFDEIIKNII